MTIELSKEDLKCSSKILNSAIWAAEREYAKAGSGRIRLRSSLVFSLLRFYRAEYHITPLFTNWKPEIGYSKSDNDSNSDSDTAKATVRARKKPTHANSDTDNNSHNRLTVEKTVTPILAVEVTKAVTPTVAVIVTKTVTLTVTVTITKTVTQALREKNTSQCFDFYLHHQWLLLLKAFVSWWQRNQRSRSKTRTAVRRTVAELLTMIRFQVFESSAILSDTAEHPAPSKAIIVGSLLIISKRAREAWSILH